MDIWMIWVCEPGGQYHWLEGAWDDDSTSENHSGWTEAVQKAHKDHGAENVRIIKTQIDFDAVVKAFEPVEVAAGPVSVA